MYNFLLMPVKRTGPRAVVQSGFWMACCKKETGHGSHHLLFDIHGFPFLAQHWTAHNSHMRHVRFVALNDRQQPPLSPCCATWLRRPISSNVLITAPTYILRAATRSDLFARSTYTLITLSLKCHRRRLLQRPPLPLRPVLPMSLESVGHATTANS